MTEPIEEPQLVAQVDDEKKEIITDDKTVPATKSEEDEEEDEYPHGLKLAAILLAAWLSMFLVALDTTILGTAIPKITDEFHSVTDVGWYASAYLLTNCGFQLIYGRIYTFYPPKWVLVGAIALFELGSIVCATAPSSKAFIIGRALAGLGGAGIFSGTINMMVLSVPLHKRPTYQGIFGAVFGLASILGPLVGGALTTRVSWRWCFYINLPIGAVVTVVILFLIPTKPSPNTLTTRQKIMRLDPFGTIVFLPGIICLLLALQWGGATYPWSNPRIIVLFILAFILITIFIIIQFKMGENATVPVRIVYQRSIASGIYFSLVTPGAMMIMVYFVPIWFQAIKGVSAVRSGIDTIPLVLPLVLGTIVSGILTNKTGYYVPQMLACSVIMSIGAGLITTFKVDSTKGQWVGYQFIFGFGLGCGMQQAGMAAQTALKKADVMTGVAIMFFFRGLGGAIFISIAQTIFSTSLISQLSSLANISPAMIIHTGATDLRDLVPAALLPKVLKGYNAALMDVFKLAVGCAAASILGGLTMEWRSLKGLKEGGQPIAKKEGDLEAKAGEQTTPESSRPNSGKKEAPTVDVK